MPRGPGHPPIQDEFTDLPISRQAKKSLRWRRDGLCVACGRPRVNKTHCEKHAKYIRDYQRERLHSSMPPEKLGELEKKRDRREEGLRLLRSGMKAGEISRRLGVTRQSVYGWAKKETDCGIK